MHCPNCNTHAKETRHALYYQLICACRTDVDPSRKRLIERWENGNNNDHSHDSGIGDFDGE